MTKITEILPLNADLQGKSIVLVGLMGAGKTSVGRRLAARLGLPFKDADAEIESAAGCSVSDLFARYGEPAFREGERKVIRRLLAGEPIVLATGGGAFMDAQTRAAIRADAVSVWLRCTLPVLVRRVSGRPNRPLLANGDPAQILQDLIEKRHPLYAEASIVVDCDDGAVDATTSQVEQAVLAWHAPRKLHVALAHHAYDILIGDNLLARAGAYIAPHLQCRRAVIVTDENVAGLHLPMLLHALAENGIATQSIVVQPGEQAKSLICFGDVMDRLLASGIDRQTTVIALGGGVIGDLAGFAAASAMRGLPFIQIPTTLLSQVDSSVGGKTGINSRHGKNLIGAFHQPKLVLADTGLLRSLPERELKAGYAEIVKAGLIADPDLFAWCEVHGGRVLAGDTDIQAEAVRRACLFKSGVVADDEREEKPNNGRALLNLGHTFAHALEAECGYNGSLLHGEAVSIGLGLAFQLSTRLGLCDQADTDRVMAHLRALQMPLDIRMLNRRFEAEKLVANMKRDKKMRDGALHMVMVRGIGAAFTCPDVPKAALVQLLRDAGCT